MTLESQAERFIETLTALEGKAGNQRLLGELGWAESTYQRVKGRLIEEGRIVSGRGRGGSVVLAEGSIPTGTSKVESRTAAPRAKAPRNGNGRNGDIGSYSHMPSRPRGCCS